MLHGKLLFHFILMLTEWDGLDAKLQQDPAA